MKPESRTNGLLSWTNCALLQAVGEQLDPLLGTQRTDFLITRAYQLLEGTATPPGTEIDVPGIRAMLYQIVRNRDPEMKLNHVTELNLAALFAHQPGRRLEVERHANERNAKLVDFALEDEDILRLVEVKNLNQPLIKRAADEAAETLQRMMKGSGPPTCDAHVSWIFFRKPRPHDLEEIARCLREAWCTHKHDDAGPPVFLPATRPVLAALFPKARPDTGGRMVLYDHGDHLGSQPGVKIQVKRTTHGREATPRERVEELCIKDNILRRIQDAEAKFPLDGRGTQRVIAFSTGDWLPGTRAASILREACAWYLGQAPLEHDFWRDYYTRWQVRWRFSPHHNIDAIVLLTGDGIAEPYGVDCIWAREGNAIGHLFVPGQEADDHFGDPSGHHR